MGMSPRLKTRRGRFTPPTNNPPTVAITSPADGATVALTSVFEGVVTDDLNVALSANIVWSSNIDGALTTGESVSLTLTAATHVITALIDDGVNSPVTASITVTAA